MPEATSLEVKVALLTVQIKIDGLFSEALCLDVKKILPTYCRTAHNAPS